MGLSAPAGRQLPDLRTAPDGVAELAVKYVRDFSVQLPAPTWARWAAILFTLSVWSYLLSIAASQALLAAASVCYAVHLLREKGSIHLPPAKLPLLLFCLLTVLSVICATAPTAGWLAVRKLVLFLILLLALNLVVTRRHLELIFQVLFLESGLVGLVAVGQFVSRYHVTRVAHPQDLYRLMAFEERVQGFMGHWMNFSGQQMLVFAALLAFMFLGRQRRRLWWLVLVIIAASIVLSLTRGVWVGCFVAGIYALFCWRPRWLLAIPVLIGVAYLFAPYLLRERIKMAMHPTADVALSIRLQMWQVGWRMIRAHPWLGVGPDNIERDYALYVPAGTMPQGSYHGHLHSNLVQLGAERGLLTLAAWVWLMTALGWHAYRALGQLKQCRWIAHAAVASWLAFVVEGCFEFNFGTSPVLMLFLFIAASPFIAQRLEYREPRKPSESAVCLPVPS